MGLLLVLLGACSGAGGADESTTTSPAATSTTAAPSTTMAPTTSTTEAPPRTLPPDAAPTELQGRWFATIDATGEEVYLILFPKTFTIDRSDVQGGRLIASGQVSVEGDSITFGAGEFCQGSGTYTWTLEADQLSLAIQGVDECGRSQVLDGVTFTLVPPPD
jgi:hypothetical protein